MPYEIAAVSAQVLCTPYNHAPSHFMQSHTRKVYACLAVTCHLRFGQNDRDLLRAAAVTRGWNGYWNKSQHRKSTLENIILQPRPFNHESGALTTELSPPPLSPRWKVMTGKNRPAYPENDHLVFWWVVFSVLHSQTVLTARSVKPSAQSAQCDRGVRRYASPKFLLYQGSKWCKLGSHWLPFT